MKGKWAIQFALQGRPVAQDTGDAVGKGLSAGNNFRDGVISRESPHPMSHPSQVAYMQLVPRGWLRKSHAQGWDINAWPFWDNVDHCSPEFSVGWLRVSLGLFASQLSDESWFFPFPPRGIHIFMLHLKLFQSLLPQKTQPVTDSATWGK